LTLRARQQLSMVALISCITQAANAGDAECLFQMGEKDVIVGPCQASDKDANGSFSIASPDGTLAASISSKGGGVGEAFWNGGAEGEATDILIGAVVLVGACWVSDKTKLCVTR
jgi:hypothetical protein